MAPEDLPLDHQPFATSLHAAASYQLGQPVLVTLEIENNTGQAYQILKWGTPLEDPLTVDCFLVSRDGQILPYDGRHVKRGDPSPDSYALIGPGEKLSHSVDISQAYAIDAPGHYTVTLNATLFDAFPVPSHAKQPPRRRRDHQHHKLPESAVSFDVVDGAQPKLTAGQASRQAAKTRKFAKSAAKTPNFDGGTQAEQDDTLIAHQNAQYFSALAAEQLTDGPDSSNALYQTWYGVFDQGRYNEVTGDYNNISGNLLSNTVTYNLTGDGCASDDFAYTHKGDDTVWLCDLYKSADQIGIDCKFGTLVHEWSHAVDSTDDNAYGEAACQKLANDDPQKAVDNADSHEYFAENNTLSNYGKTITVVTDRDTFGKDEIDAMFLQAKPAVIPEAFYVQADGFWPDKLNITAASLGNSPNIKPTFTLTPAVSGISIAVMSLQAEDPALPIAPQRFTWVCQISFSDDSGFPTSPGAVQDITLTADVNGFSGSAQIHLIDEPNPYEIDGATSWLSTDVRVFQIRDGDGRFNATLNSGPSAFIKQVIGNLNSGNSAGETFDSISTDEQTSALELSQKVNGTGVFNFAVAKVRYRGTTDIPNVRVFFRLFPTNSTTTIFDAGTTYRRATSGGNAIPLLGLSGSGDLLTIPCFAEGRVDSSVADLTTQPDPANVQPIVHDPGGNEVAAYFGCWLDINQADPQFPNKPSPANGPWTSGRKSVQQLIRNAHQCLVAEIAFDPDPIPPGVAPSQSDKLAQRNLTIVKSANPGFDASRRIVTTFELRPAPAIQAPNPGPDELLIEWGNTPSGSLASIYIPEISASQVLALAGKLYPNHNLTQLDDQTIQMPVGGISYVPLPPGAAFGITGLLTVDLPDTVRKGDVYKVVVRQLTDAYAPPPIVIFKTGQPGPLPKNQDDSQNGIRWRRVVGSYQMTIPVSTKDVMLAPELRLYSVLLWILKSVPATDRWYPAFSRYVSAIGTRVGALGGSPGTVQPSPDGSGAEPSPTPEPVRTRRYEGKITGLVYDCFGDFEGFLLDECGKELKFEAREHRIEALVRTAWRERILIDVVTTTAHPHKPVSIVFRRAPEPFQA